MKSFGRLVRKMRGGTPLEEVARRLGREALFLEQLETGRFVPDERLAQQILRRGFELDGPDARRAVLGIQLYDLGLKDNEIRQLVLDVIQGEASGALLTQVRQLYRRNLA